MAAMCIILNWNYLVFILISLMLISNELTENNSALVQIIAWHVPWLEDEQPKSHNLNQL